MIIKLKRRKPKHTRVEFVGVDYTKVNKEQLEAIQKSLDELNNKLLTKNEELIRRANS